MITYGRSYLKTSFQWSKYRGMLILCAGVATLSTDHLNSSLPRKPQIPRLKFVVHSPKTLLITYTVYN